MNPAISDTPTTAIATVDGLATGLIPNVFRVDITSSVNTKLATLPAPVVGARLSVFCAANGYNLQSNDPATVGINAGVGAGKKLAIAAGDRIDLECTTLTNWVAVKTSAAGVIATAGAAA